jgi:two-component system OmpR family sensor kinase
MSVDACALDRFRLTPSAARAHAMKNCLTAIMATCDLMERQPALASRRLWNSLRVASNRLRDLLAEQLATETVRCVAASRHRYDWCSVEVVTQLVAERLHARAEDAGVRLAINCGGGEIRGDEDSLVEALVDLTANAIEATLRGGTVNLETRQTNRGDQVWVVKDAGRGFAEARLGESGHWPSIEDEGWGLGIALAQAAVAHHGGAMTIGTALSEGTKITIWLPQEHRRPFEPTHRGQRDT